MNVIETEIVKSDIEKQMKGRIIAVPTRIEIMAHPAIESITQPEEIMARLLGVMIIVPVDGMEMIIQHLEIENPNMTAEEVAQVGMMGQGGQKDIAAVGMDVIENEVHLLNDVERVLT